MIQHSILPGISIRLIQALVAEHYGLEAAEIRGPCRIRKFAWPRQMAIALCLEFLPNKATTTIGHHFGGRDHATVYHAQRAVLERAQADPEIREALAALRLAIEAYRPAEIQLELLLAE